MSDLDVSSYERFFHHLGPRPLPGSLMRTLRVPLHLQCFHLPHSPQFGNASSGERALLVGSTSARARPQEKA
jgi:hypothetical protein